jgi:UDP-N-acetylmuramate--alanine ligase
MKLANIKTVYFIGIGGIGMSAIARYFLGRGVAVHGYDRTETTLTQALVKEGMKIHYSDDISFIPPSVDLVIYTPAVPNTHSELLFFLNNHIPVLKRAAVLGIISRGMRCIAVAGTHGKTTTTSILTHVLRVGGVDVTAFLGGISLSLGSNFVQGTSDWVVVEADEYDRSFLQLNPDIAVINSLDPDHLDIYGTEKDFRLGFALFAARLKKGGRLLIRTGLRLPKIPKRMWSKEQNVTTAQKFGLQGGDYRATKIRVEDGFFVFDYQSPMQRIANIKTTLPGKHNVENAVAAIAVAEQLGVSAEAIKTALANFSGIRRRFEFVLRNEKNIFIDDYAHHPTELAAAIGAAKMLYPTRRILGIFQPHLFSRTRDFQLEFAEALDKLDEIILLDIYPARELPMEGVTANIIFDKMKNPHKTLTTKADLLSVLTQKEVDVVMTLGAGDIDTLVVPIKDWLNEQ